MKYTVDLKGWGHISTRIVEAASPQEAMDKAMREAGLSAHVRQVALLAQQASEIVTEVENEDRGIKQFLFAAVIQHYGTELPFNEITHVEFYWANDYPHARDQAEDANEGCDIIVREVIPNVWREDDGELGVDK